MSPAGPFIECAKCHDRIQSTHRHDWVPCKCGETYVDGGDSYLRVGGSPLFNADHRIATFPEARADTGELARPDEWVAINEKALRDAWLRSDAVGDSHTAHSLWKHILNGDTGKGATK